jgi:sigma-B regulation protein RsbU (phosphoserine phosphatase)
LRILIAEDDAVSRLALALTLRKWGHDSVVAEDGAQAWAALQGEDAPNVVLLDWMMPYLDGLEVCRLARSLPRHAPLHIIMLTAKGAREDVIAGLDAGADDYILKPFAREELRARLSVATRIVGLQQSLEERVRELEGALASVHQLRGLLPICSYCKAIRHDENYWQRLNTYITEHSDLQFSHGICPGCYDREVIPQLESLRKRQEKEKTTLRG